MQYIDFVSRLSKVRVRVSIRVSIQVKFGLNGF